MQLLLSVLFSAVQGTHAEVPAGKRPLEAKLLEAPHRWATASQNSCQGTVNSVLRVHDGLAECAQQCSMLHTFGKSG
jgi:hypothetical protein